jgi:hypothetical protein
VIRKLLHYRAWRNRTLRLRILEINKWIPAEPDGQRSILTSNPADWHEQPIYYSRFGERCVPVLSPATLPSRSFADQPELYDEEAQLKA